MGACASKVTRPRKIILNLYIVTLEFFEPRSNSLVLFLNRNPFSPAIWRWHEIYLEFG